MNPAPSCNLIIALLEGDIRGIGHDGVRDKFRINKIEGAG